MLLFELYSDSEKNNLFEDLLDIFIKICTKSIHNCFCCSKELLSEFLLDLFPTFVSKEKIQQKIVNLITVLLSRNLKTSNLKRIISFLQQSSSLRITDLFVQALKMMTKVSSYEPKFFFDFNGINSNLNIQSKSKWPPSSGYSFLGWIRLESFPHKGNQKNAKEPKLTIFSFDNSKSKFKLFITKKQAPHKMAKDKHQLSSHNIEDLEAVEMQNEETISVSFNYTVKFNNTKESSAIQTEIPMRKWIFISLVHKSSFLSSNGDLSLFIDSRMVKTLSQRYPKTSEIVQARIGSKTNLKHFFFGQMGSIYLFNKALKEEQIHAIYSLKPNYSYSFVPIEWAFDTDPNFVSSKILSENLNRKLFLKISAQYCNQDVCYDYNAKTNSCIQKMEMDHVVIIKITNIFEGIFKIGGVVTMLPFFLKFDNMINENLNENLNENYK
ncbi:hypothetical protein M0811_12322 [Anaeramoeba ignava]|uniref:Uncharacterized protein n=1 Tax=Anaeramoeba ignava TaxID=1746090 RepID=A0A9Q0R736_ANAIG|nr:hypothetical protein M0811_12322 [Anaeramoeba ignava]